MRFAKKMALWAFCAVPAAAAMLVTGAGMASAAPTPYHPHPISHCNPWQRESWNVNGSNTVKLTWGTSSYTYAVALTQKGSCVGGTLTDLNLPGPLANQTLAVTGVIYNNYITFSVNYGHTSIQGKRTFTGDINRWGRVSGNWSETGSENGTGTWSLQYRAHPACWWVHPGSWNPRQCRVWS
ncbi:MAG: hypothetical protein WAK82_12460 [Streptosporangiaceae bacterium]